MDKELLRFCECGECGLRVTKPGNRFRKGHNKNNLGKHLSQKTKDKISKTRGDISGKDHPMYGKKHSDETKAEMSKIKLKENDPLLNGWEIKVGIIQNKECTMYLGCYIAEQILSKIFKDVKVMPLWNHGYDFICGNGLKIDVKSSATGYQDFWHFNINKNEIADYFLCIAFDNREDLNPEYLWLLPGNIINKQMGIQISKSTLHKWVKYEQPLDKVIACCNKMKGD